MREKEKTKQRTKGENSKELATKSMVKEITNKREEG
jgi:hypothetical protein